MLESVSSVETGIFMLNKNYEQTGEKMVEIKEVKTRKDLRIFARFNEKNVPGCATGYSGSDF